MKRFWQLLILCLALMPCGAFAGYPEKPITLLVPYTAGGATSTCWPVGSRPAP